MKKIQISTCFYLAICFVFSTFVACGKSEETAQAQPTAVEVEVAKVIQKDMPMNVEFVGQVVGSIDAEIRARVEGVLLGIHFEEGKEVKEGQLLYTIDPAPYDAKVAEALGKVSEAETLLTKAQSDLKRVRPLAEMKALSARDLDAAIAQEGAAKGSVDAANAALESAKIQLGYCKITSPTTGVIGLSKAKVGEFVGKAPNPVVLNTVSKLDPIHVKFTVNEKEYLYFAKLKQKEIAEGKESKKRVLELYLADGSKHNENGEVASIDRQIDATTGSLTIEAAFPNPYQLLRPGQFAKIKTIAETVANAILIPKKAIRELQGQYQVFVVQPDSTVVQKTITVGTESDGLQVVESGLSADETIVTDGVQRLKTGMLIKARN